MGFFKKLAGAAVGGPVGYLAASDPGAFFSTDTLLGAGSGAATGALAGGLPGAAVGAGIGGYVGYKKHQAAQDQQDRLKDARSGLDQKAAELYAQRKADLAQALGYFQPVDDYMQRRYGQQSAADAPRRGLTRVV